MLHAELLVTGNLIACVQTSDIVTLIMDYLAQSISCQTCFSKQHFYCQFSIQRCFFCSNTIFFEIVQPRQSYFIQVQQKPAAKTKKRKLFN